jgi:hypothetical protein
MAYSYTGSVATVVTINPGAVSGYVTSGPVMGTSTGTMLSAGDGIPFGASPATDIILEQILARKMELAMTVDENYIKVNKELYEFGGDGDYKDEDEDAGIEIETPLQFDEQLMFSRDRSFWTEETRDSATDGPYKRATYIALAIHDFWKNSIFMTNNQTVAPMPAPAPAGPVVVAGMTGTGGVGKSTPGTGWAAAQPILFADLFKIFNDMSDKPIGIRCDEIAAALVKYFKEASITTIDVTAQVNATVDPYTGSGAYVPGVTVGVGIFV